MNQTQTAIILVTDLVDSTAHRSKVGEDAAEALRRRHDLLLGEAITSRHGLVVKHLGDGMLATFTGAAEAVSAAVAIQQSVDGEFAVRVGISAGDVTFEDDDVFGMPVIEASRLCAHATGGEILVSDLARMLARGRGGHTFESIGELDLKGLPERVVTSRVGWEPVDNSTVPYPAALMNTSNLPYAGRSALLDQVVTQWKHAAEGEAGMLLISGEPGMGKTRLAIEVAERASAAGGIVLFGRADEEITSSYRPFAEAIGHLITHAPADVIDAHVDEFAGSLATVTSALIHRRPDVVPLAGSIEEVRATVFDAVVDLLARVGRTAPVLLILDDLHWADESTLLLVRHLGRSLRTQRLLVLGTYRDTDLVRGHHLSSVLADLRRVDRVERVDLSGLDESGVVELMSRLGGQDPDERLVELAVLVLSETEGNPFFVGEILFHLSESGKIYQADGRWESDAETAADLGVPQGIREVVGHRLDSLTPEANAALRTAAVIGQEFDLKVLARAIDESEDHLLDLLDPVLARSLISEMPGEIDRFRFPHALVRQTLYEELSASRRVRVHARIADAYASLPRYEAAQLAHHRIEAAAVTELELVAKAAKDAANEAMATYAWETAIDWIDRALDAADDQDDDGRVRGRLLLAKARVMRAATRFAEARAEMIETARLARATGDHELLFETAITYAGSGNAWMAHDDTLGLELVEEAERLVPADAVHRGQLLIARASLMLLSTNRADVVEPAREGLALVREAVPEVLGAAQMVMCEALRATPDIEEMYAVATDLEQAIDPSERSVAFYWKAVALLGRPDLRAAGDLAAQMIEEGGRRRQRVLSWSGYQTRASLHVLAGRFDDGLADIEEMATFADSLGDTGISAVNLARLLLFQRRRDIDGVRTELTFLRDHYPAFYFDNEHLFVGQLDDSVTPAELGAAVDSWIDEKFTRLPYMGRVPLIAATAPALRHASAATAALAERELDGFGDLWLNIGCHDPAGHIGWTRGPLAMAQGRLDEAIGHLETALASHLAFDELPIRANGSLFLVEALLERGGPGDAARARELADDAAAVADRIGIIGLADLLADLVG